MASPLRCVYCGCDLSPNGDYFQAVTGWEKPGRGLNARSGSSLVLRERVPGRAACVRCITRLRHGVGASQETLL